MSISTVSIPGIHCEGCAKLIQDVSRDYPQIKKIDIDTQTKRVTIEHDRNFDIQAWSKEIETLNEKYSVKILSQT